MQHNVNRGAGFVWDVEGYVGKNFRVMILFTLALSSPYQLPLTVEKNNKV